MHISSIGVKQNRKISLKLFLQVYSTDTEVKSVKRKKKFLRLENDQRSIFLSISL